MNLDLEKSKIAWNHSLKWKRFRSKLMKHLGKDKDHSLINLTVGKKIGAFKALG